MNMTLDHWIDSRKHLPAFMRDFHDQKRLFKLIDEIVQRRRDNHNGSDVDRLGIGLINWVQAHVYVIDFFLWSMAMYGHTLQRSHKHLDFMDIDTDLKDFDKRMAEQFNQFVKDIQAKE